MSQQETADFLEAVARELERRELPTDVGDGEIRVQRRGQWNAFGLSNLAQLCHHVGRKEWQGAITSHFDNLFVAADAEDEFEQLSRDLDRVRPLLKVRLYAAEALEGLGIERPASWEVAPGLIAAFVYDLPTTVRTATDDQIATWNASRDELLAIALENVQGDTVECRPITEGASGLVGCVADHFFAASHALLLGTRLPSEAHDSAVFAVPHRHALLYAPVVDLGIVDSINRLVVTAASLYQEGPGSITPRLYWWRASSVELLPSSFDGKRVEFAPPDEFVQLLNTLAAAS